MPLFDLEGADLDPGYLNLRTAELPVEQAIKAELEAMWVRFEPYADADFAAAFARDPDPRFWEMYLGCALLDAGKRLQPRANRPEGQGNPDFCVIDGDRRIWIEAIAPDVGDPGEDQVPDLVMAEDGGGAQVQPLRQIHLRITSALWTKKRALEQYRVDGVIGEQDVCLVAIGGGRFALQAAGEDFPTALSAVYPIGDEFVRVNRDNHQVVAHGYHRAEVIERAAGNIPRTAFFDGRFAHVSGLIWSRASIGNMYRAARPMSLIHNHASENPMPRGWTAWEMEYAAVPRNGGWVFPNLRAQA
jgi:hypothetical protein